MRHLGQLLNTDSLLLADGFAMRALMLANQAAAAANKRKDII
jgi:hypothetical protein